MRIIKHMTTFHIDIEKAFRFGWEKTKKHFWLILSVMVFSFVVSSIFEALSFSYKNSGYYFGRFIFSFFGWVFNALVNIGIIHMSLMLINDRAIKFKNFFDKSYLFLNYIIGTVLYFAAIAVGLILLIVPGIIFMIRFQFYRFLIIEKEMNPLEAFSKSWDMTRGQSLGLIKIFLAIIGLNILGALALGVGLFVTVPVSLIAYAFVYNKLVQVDSQAK